jgi:hypothetical protein
MARRVAEEEAAQLAAMADSWQLEGEVARHVRDQLEVVALARQIFHSTICDLTMCGDMIFFTCRGEVSVVTTLGPFFGFFHIGFFLLRKDRLSVFPRINNNLDAYSHISYLI